MANLPVDRNTRPAVGGYSPAQGVVALQMGTPTFDKAGVASAPGIVQAQALAGVVYLAAATAYTATSATGSGALSVGQYRELAYDATISAVSGTTPSLTLILERQGADGNWYQVFASSAITAAGVVSASLGAGLSTAVAFGQTVRVRWTITGTTPSFTVTHSLIGK